MKLVDKYGWPVMVFRDRRIVNFFRYIIHVNIRKTWEVNFGKKKDKSVDQDTNCGEYQQEP